MLFVTLCLSVVLTLIYTYRRFVSILDVPGRKVIYRYRIIGCVVLPIVGLVCEIMPGSLIFTMDERLRLILGGIPMIVVLGGSEWLGEYKLRELGYKTSGILSRKLY